MNFVEDMGKRPSDDHSIERINIFAGYCPANCTWIPLSDQSKNTRRVGIKDIDWLLKMVALYCKAEAITSDEFARLVEAMESPSDNL